MKSRILLATFLFFGFAVQAQKEVTKKFSGVKSVRMKTASGSCQLKKSPDASVSVQVKYTYSDDVFRPAFEQTGDRLVVEESFHANSVSGNAQWTLLVPDGVSIRFTTGSGDIQASDMKLDLDATTGSGDLIFAHATGEVKATTGSGDLELDSFDGVADINIGSGSAQVVASKGDLNVNCGSGNIRLSDSQAEFQATTGSGDVTARNLTLNGSSKFTSGSGDATVVLAATPKHSISVNSGSGNAELNFNGNEITGEIVMQASKRSGNIQAPFEFDKTEEIDNGGSQPTVRKTVVKGNSNIHVRVSTGSGDAVLKK